MKQYETKNISIGTIRDTSYLQIPSVLCYNDWVTCMTVSPHLAWPSITSLGVSHGVHPSPNVTPGSKAWHLGFYAFKLILASNQIEFCQFLNRFRQIFLKKMHVCIFSTMSIFRGMIFGIFFWSAQNSVKYRKNKKKQKIFFEPF